MVNLLCGSAPAGSGAELAHRRGCIDRTTHAGRTPIHIRKLVYNFR